MAGTTLAMGTEFEMCWTSECVYDQCTLVMRDHILLEGCCCHWSEIGFSGKLLGSAVLCPLCSTSSFFVTA